MKLALMAILAFFTLCATYLFVYWVPLSLIPGALDRPIILNIIALIAGIGMGYLVWRESGKMTDGLCKYVFLGGIILGTVVFLSGFIGPLIFFPHNNLGPLYGFVLGPIGFFLGCLGGGMYWKFGRVKKTES